MVRFAKRTAPMFLALFVLCAIAFPAAAALASAVGVVAVAIPHVGPVMFMAYTNSLGNYNETFFAQEALIQLEKVLGMAGRVYREYNANPQIKGSTIQIRRPSSFVAQSAPATASNLNTDQVSITLNGWEEVKFALTDKDLTLSSDKIISDHIRPAAVALADKVDQDLAILFKLIPWYTVMSATPALADISAIRQIMFNNKVPLKDAAMLHFMIGGAEEAAFLNAMTVLQNPQAAGLRDGSIGRLYGYDTWANQNTPTFTSGTAADYTGDLAAATSVGDATINVENITTAGTVKVGDIVTITGDPQQYCVAADATASGGAIAALSITPKIKNASLISAVVTIFLGGSAKTQNIAFHRNAFALATAPLSEMGNALGAKIATVGDPLTGLSLRSRLFYIGDSSEVRVALDILYGVACLDPNLACRGYQH